MCSVLSHAWCFLLAAVVVSVTVVTPARAQLAVIDVPAIVQLVQEVQNMAQQVETARQQLTQAQQALQTMTGDRGMEYLLSGTPRNYLPSTWPQLVGAMRGGAGGYPALTSDIRVAIGANAVLSAQQLSALSPVNQQQIAAGRQTSALRQALAQESLTNASGRFTSLQTLVSAIGTATDQKSALDLQARIAAELGMLQNEQTKLQVLHQATQAQEALNRQQQREQIVAGHGLFQSRFQPAP